MTSEQEDELCGRLADATKPIAAHTISLIQCSDRVSAAVLDRCSRRHLSTADVSCGLLNRSPVYRSLRAHHASLTSMAVWGGLVFEVDEVLRLLRDFPSLQNLHVGVECDLVCEEAEDVDEDVSFAFFTTYLFIMFTF